MSVQAESDAAVMRTVGAPAQPGESKYDRLIANAKSVPAAKTVVAHPCDDTSLRGPIEAAGAGLIVPILVGPAAKIKAVARDSKLDISKIELVDAPHSDAAGPTRIGTISSAPAASIGPRSEVSSHGCATTVFAAGTLLAVSIRRSYLDPPG